MQLAKLREKAQAFYATHRLTMGGLIAFSIPLKLAIAYIFLIPTILLWLCTHWPFRIELFSRIERAFMFFLGAVILSSALGVDPQRSFRALPSLVFFFFAVPFFSDIFREKQSFRCIAWLLIGQAIAAFHSVLQAAFPEQIRGFFLGSVTESGQLSLTAILALGLILCVSDAPRDLLSNRYFANCRVLPSKLFLGLLHLGILLFLGFHSTFTVSSIFIIFMICISTALIVFHIAPLLYKAPREQIWFQQFVDALVTSITPLLFMALLVNLKRGPWFGVALAVALLLWFFRRKFVVPAVFVGLILFATVTPIRERLLKSSEHFFIQGGRNAIWDVGIELLERYPLGIGFDNSLFLRMYSPDIPMQLRHFHNNLLNIVVENGWVALSLYLWWLAAIFAISWRRNAYGQRSTFLATIGCAILSWQLAGIVEYNFGDSEVVLVAYLITGLLVAHSSTEDSKTYQSTPEIAPPPLPLPQSAG